MRDNFGRNIDYIRLSLTDLCQLRCGYCVPDENVSCLKAHEQLTYDEIKEIVAVFSTLGVKKVKLTGGEPLLYPKIMSLIQDLKKLTGIEEVTLTTNGIKLPETMADLVKAGLDSVNISLDTLNPVHYAEITRVGRLEDALKGVTAAVESQIKKVKVNTVLLPSLTEADLRSLVNLAKDTRANVRFIEKMPMGNQVATSALSEAEIKHLLTQHYGEVTPFLQPLGNGPARYYEVEGFKGKVGFISAMSRHFCETCNRMRVTSDGFLKTCLAFSHGVNLKQAISDGCLEAKILEALQEKPKRHLFGQEVENKELKSMIQIGG